MEGSLVSGNTVAAKLGTLNQRTVRPTPSIKRTCQRLAAHVKR